MTKTELGCDSKVANHLIMPNSSQTTTNEPLYRDHTNKEKVDFENNQICIILKVGRYVRNNSLSLS